MPTEEKKVTRKLSAILSADVKGYSVLMADDEIHTIETLKAYRQIISDLVLKYSGRVVDSPGDNILAEFRSSVDAVECAVKIQKRLDQENSKYADDKKVEFRIGVNVGDVIQDGDRIYGNGVNVAARIEGLADAGGVCISRNAYDHIRNKLKYGYEYLGEHSVKNIDIPVRVYKLLMADEDAGKLIGDVAKSMTKNWIWAIVVMVTLVIAVVGMLLYQNRSKPGTERTKVEEFAPPLIDKYSIAVLPFVNISGDPEQEHFSDGLADDLITDLSKISDLLVISSNSTFAYKGKSINVKEVAKELNVRYVVEGSVRKVGDQIRINAQLIDAKTDHHMWAERYDGQMDNIFALQDKITSKIVTSLAIKLSDEEYVDIAKQDTENIAAYNAFLKGSDSISRYEPEVIYRGLKYFEEAVRLDPNYYRAWAALAESYLEVTMTSLQLLGKLGISLAEGRLRARHYLNKSMKKPTDISYRVASRMAALQRQNKKALSLAAKAVAINPNIARNINELAMALQINDRPKEAIKYANRALRIDPGCLF